jgi:hypothetical protein
VVDEYTREVHDLHAAYNIGSGEILKAKETTSNSPSRFSDIKPSKLIPTVRGRSATHQPNLLFTAYKKEITSNSERTDGQRKVD